MATQLSNRGPRAARSELQRLRLVNATVEVACELGCQGTSVTAIAARAGVSRKTFYEHFRSRDDCLQAVIEGALDQIARVVLPAYSAESGWSERLRAALAALLAFLEREPDVGGLALSYILGYGPYGPQGRTRVLEPMWLAVEQGRSKAKPDRAPSLFTAEVVVSGVLSVVDARLQERPPQLMALVNPLMWMIVLPYRGPAAAARELRRTLPATPRRPALMHVSI